ncbi:MAG: efflux RND transporter permease subunit, partial [Planctomycetota bacterium]
SYPSVYYNLIMNQDNSANYAQAVVHTTDSRTTDRVVRPLQDKLDAEFPGARIVVNKFGQGPPVAADIEYRIFGDDLDTLQDLGEQLRLRLQRHPDVVHASMSVARGTPKLWIEADEDEARLAGLDTTDVARQLAANLIGVTGGSVLEGTEELPVRVRHAGDGRTSAEAVASTQLATPGGGYVPLSAIGELTLRPTEAGISRYDGLRINTIEAFTREGSPAQELQKSILEEAENSGFVLPPGYTIGFGGEAEQSGDSQGNLASFAPAIVLILVATLILTFRSLRMAGMLFVIAGSCVGFALLSTWSISLPIGFNMILGTLGLIGVALNDSIVVISSIRNNPDARAGDREALIKEVIGCTRHVLSTTFTTLGGFAPLLLLAEGDFWPSLAIVLFGGILGAMLLALFFIPAAYVVFHPRKFGLIGTGPSESDDVPAVPTPSFTPAPA